MLIDACTRAQEFWAEMYGMVIDGWNFTFHATPVPPPRPYSCSSVFNRDDEDSPFTPPRCPAAPSLQLQ